MGLRDQLRSDPVCIHSQDGQHEGNTCSYNVVDKHDENSIQLFKKLKTAVLKYGEMFHSRNSQDDHEGKDLMGCDRSTQWNIIVAIKSRSNYGDHVGTRKKFGHSDK